MEGMPDSFALLETSPGTVVLGHGPFEQHAEAPESGTAFYVDDFGLSSSLPWYVPAEVEVLTPDTPWPFEGRSSEVAWSEPDAGGFRTVFAEVAEAIGSLGVLKMVPVLPQRGVLISGDHRSFLAGLEQGREWQWRYGFGDGERGFCGVTPELLFRMDGDRLETMALAGTSELADEAAFLHDAKEIREHELVASYLEEILEDLGKLEREPRGIMRLGGMTHFRTSLRVQLRREMDIRELIRTLHPTPAVGCLPRQADVTAKLAELRHRAGCPQAFGAPFGLLHEGSFHAVIAIRGLFWDGDKVDLPAGCGLIAESQHDSEWAELALKRDAVRRIFGLGA